MHHPLFRIEERCETVSTPNTGDPIAAAPTAIAKSETSIPEALSQRLRRQGLTPRSASTGLAIFREGGAPVSEG